MIFVAVLITSVTRNIGYRRLWTSVITCFNLTSFQAYTYFTSRI